LPEKRTILLLTGVLLASALAPLGSTSIAVAIPQIAQFMGMDSGTTTQLLVGGYLLISVIGQAPAGKLGDIIGYQKALFIGLAVFMLGSLIGYLVRSIEALLIARMMMAGASAMIVPNASALLRTQLPESLLPFAYGVFGATMGAAAAVGPLLGGALTQLFDWPAIFLVNVPWALVALGLIVLTSKKQTEKRQGRLDLRSTVLLALAIGCLQMGFLGSAVDFRYLLPGIVLLGLFILLQLKVEEPVFNPRFLRRPAYLAAGCSTALGNFTMYALLFQLPIFFYDIRGVAEIEIASALTAMTLCMMLGGPLSGVVGRYIGPRYTAAVAACINLFGLYLFSDLATAIVPADIIIPMAIMGFAGGMAGPVVQSAGMLAISKDDAGMAAGGLSTMRYFGGTIGISVLSLQLGSDGVTTLAQHLSIIPFYAVSLALVLLAAFLLPVSNNAHRSEIK
jgi:MFS family permease|tara:strand:+ start:1746 stop:3098 length:1353 start_codon:yes stop_codon:yes gene_type:complete